MGFLIIFYLTENKVNKKVKEAILVVYQYHEKLPPLILDMF